MEDGGGFILDGNSLYVERGAYLYCVSFNNPQLKVCSGRDCTDTNATYYIGSATSYSTWDTSGDGPAHDASSIFVPGGHTVDVNDSTNRSWINYKNVGVYGEK